MNDERKSASALPLKCLIIVYSYHHHNTLKIAEEFSKVLKAKIMAPDHVVLEELQEYDLIGFGAGIDSGRHYKPLLDLVDRLPDIEKKDVFIFSTSAIQGERKVKNDHTILRQKLESKGYSIQGEFSCKGFNTNLFLKYIGGMNKGRPNDEDIKHANEFASNLVNMQLNKMHI